MKNDKIAIIYASVHHQNTKKVVDYIASHAETEMDIIDITKNECPDISGADVLVFASGIYFDSMHKAITRFIEGVDLRGKGAIVLYTCGMKYRDHARATGKLLKKRNAVYRGSCCCRGFDTCGILGKIGGIAKGHPNDQDMARVLSAFNRLLHSTTYNRQIGNRGGKTDG